MENELTFGIVGTGLIAGVIAESIATSNGAVVSAVSSRTLAKAQAFVEAHGAGTAVEGVEALLARDDVEAVYIACPTIAKEDIALAAITAGKHVLVDKPFMDSDSLTRMVSAAAAKGVAFMDATHFVHHPRTEAIRTATPERIGSPRSLYTAFYFPFADRTNIRYDPAQEPTGALGDMAWYSMRAAVEYLQPQGELVTTSALAQRDDETGAVIRLTGLIGFASGETSTFDVGYTADTLVMDFSLLGTTGGITMDDFVLDWNKSFAFQNPEIRTGYSYRTEMNTRDDVTFIETSSDTAADVLMIDHFVEIARSDDRAAARPYTEAALNTQRYLDAIWSAIT